MAPSKNKRKRSKTEASSVEVALLYQQDLGTAAIKKKRRSEPVMTLNAFDLPMTKAEKKKRNKRKVRNADITLRNRKETEVIKEAM